MPKMKSKRGAAKRFRVRGSGSIKRGGAYRRHILTKKSTKTKRQLRGKSEVHSTNTAAIRSMLPYSS
jgi:large subunit ribosomal protein L35